VNFAEATTNLIGFEILTLAPREFKKGLSLGVMPPAWIDTTGFPPGSLSGHVATPEVARRNKNTLLL